MDFEQIKELINMVNNSELRELQLSLNGTLISMSKNDGALKPVKIVEKDSEKNDIEEHDNRFIQEEKQEIHNVEAKSGNIIKSPIVGTFYASAKPSSPALKSKGDKVKKGEVVCIIEAMKIMNEITSDYDGTIEEIFVENEQVVEFGQPLFMIV